SLQGTGQIRANAGDSQGSFGWHGAGGGRIAVYANDFSGFDTTHIFALGSRDGGSGTVYLRDLDDSSGTLIIGGPSIRSTPLGLPGQNLATFIDHVIVRGTTAVPEHDGLILRFEAGLEVQNLGGQLITTGDVDLGPDSTLRVASHGLMRVAGTLTSAAAI